VEDTKGNNGTAGEIHSGSFVQQEYFKVWLLAAKPAHNHLNTWSFLHYLHAVTNMRLLWWSKKSKRSNISIGFGCFLTLTTKASTSRLKGTIADLK
jgi:hypothetical protein